jgi:glycosyltransferase involved in cell wall biosynthesis
MNKVSIIIPVYNVEPYIERCLLSVLNQTYENIEIILVDDCGQDNSMSVARQITEDHPNGHKIRFLKNECNKGPSVARNKGIKSAIGEYIYFLDSDDEITLNCIETLFKESEGFDLVIGGAISGSGTIFFNNQRNTFENEDVRNAYFSGLINSMTCNKLVSRKFILSNNLFLDPDPENLHEDFLWCFFVLMACRKMKIIETTTYIYHIRENTRNTNFTIKNINAYIYGYNIIKSHIVRNYPNNLLAMEYLIDKAYGILSMSIWKSKCSFSGYKDLTVFDPTIRYVLSNKKIRIKYLFLRLPKLFQYFMLKCCFYPKTRK